MTVRLPAPSTPQERSRSPRRLLGHILTREGIITQAQLEHALRLQEAREPHRLLGQILVDQGAVAQKQLDLILEKYCLEGRFGDLLVETRAISENQLRIARDYQKKTDRDLGEILVQLGFLTERRVTEALSRQLNIPIVDLDACALDSRLSSLINESYARRHRVIPIARGANQITVCLENPMAREVAEELRASIGSKVEVVTSTRDAFERALDRLYGLVREPKPRLPLHEHEQPADPCDGAAPKASTPQTAATPGSETPRTDAPERRNAGGISREEKSAMAVANGSNPHSLVDVVRRMTTDCQAAVGGMETLIQENTAQRARLEQLQREHDDLRGSHEELRRRLDARVEELTKLEAERDALLTQCEAGAGALAELREQHQALAQARDLAKSQMEAALRQLGA